MRTTIDIGSAWQVGAVDDLDMARARLTSDRAFDETVWYDTDVPADVHLVLFRAGVIPDPHLSNNAAEVQWVGETSWVFRTEFPSPAPLGGPVRLVFRCVDTLGEVFLNGESIAVVDDQFREHRIEVTSRLAPAGATNRLAVLLAAPAVWTDEHEAPEQYRQVFRHYFLRKGSGDFSAYLGARPRFLHVGLPRPVELDVADEASLENIQVRVTDLSEARAALTVDVQAGPGSSPDGTLEWVLADPEGRSVAAGTEPATRRQLRIEVLDPQLWWPRSHGRSPLYELTVRRLAADGRPTDERSVAVGIRTVHLDLADPVTGEERFRWRINGVPVFLRGAGWAPVEGLTHVWQPDRARRLLDMVEHADMNTIRVWGGGLVPEDEFYDECDRRGILLWQDFMFEYHMYPAGLPEFDDNVRAEVVETVVRLRNHPSIVAWIGGNENHMGWDFQYGTAPQLGRSLYEQVMPALCQEQDGTRPYHYNSPHNAEPGSPEANLPPNWPLSGDWHDYTTLTFSPWASVPAFASEYGRVSAPSLQSMRKFLTPEELWPVGHEATIRHPGQPSWPATWAYHSADGAWSKIGALQDYLEPSGPGDLVRALGMAHGEYLYRRTARQRRGRPDGDRTPGRRCWGSLIWRLNDGWPILYWSVIDSYLEPKIPYWFIRRAFATVLISFEQTADQLAVWITNDGTDPVDGTLTVRRGRLDGTVGTSRVNNAAGRQGAPVADDVELRTELSVPVRVEAGQSLRATDLDAFGLISLREDFLEATVGEWSSTHLLHTERYLTLPAAALDVTVADGELTVRTDAYARTVTIEKSLEFESVMVADNYFDLPPGRSRSIGFESISGTGTFTVSALNAAPVTVHVGPAQAPA